MDLEEHGNRSVDSDVLMWEEELLDSGNYS